MMMLKIAAIAVMDGCCYNKSSLRDADFLSSIIFDILPKVGTHEVVISGVLTNKAA
jgi:hypothetical protein